MTGYTVTDFEAGDEMRVEGQDEVEVRREAGRNEGHPKLHGGTFEISFGLGRMYGLNPHPLSAGLTFALNWTV